MDLGCLRHTCLRICCGTPVGPGRGTGYRGPLFCERVPKTFWGMVQKKAADTQRLRNFYRLIADFSKTFCATITPRLRSCQEVAKIICEGTAPISSQYSL